MLDWVLFNILIFNFDAHGKNISFFISKKGISLTPFYDLVNIKMHPEFDQNMAMALGDEFESKIVNAYELADFADTCRLSRRLVARQLKLLIDKAKSALDYDVQKIAKTEAGKNYLEKYKKFVIERCEQLIDTLDKIAKVEL